MKNIRNILILLALFTGACAPYSEVKIGDVKEVHLHSLGLKKATMDVSLEIENPNHKKFDITEVSVELYIEEERAGMLNTVDKVQILPQSKEVYEFPVEIAFESILETGIMFMKVLKKKEVNITLQGYIKVRAFPLSRKIPVNEKYLVPVKR